MNLSFISAFFYKLLLFIVSLSVGCGGGLLPSSQNPIEASSDDVLLNVVAWADPQVSDYLLSRQTYTLAACKDVAQSNEEFDAMLIAGDIAENGKSSEYQLILDDLSLIKNVKSYVFATGNHDIRLRLFDQANNTFLQFCKAADSNFDAEKLYYTREINGFSFIVLGSVRTEFEEAYFDTAELNWLDTELKAAAVDGKPVFVVLHQPLKYTHGLPNTWNSPIESAGSVGAQSDDLKNILNKYNNVFLLTGHLHTGFSNYTFEEIGNIHSVSLPAIGIAGKDEGGNAGTGYIIEVYDDSVLFRARDFAAGVYIKEFDREYTLVK